MVYNTLHRKLKIEKKKNTYPTRNWDEELAVLPSLVSPVVLLKPSIKTFIRFKRKVHTEN